MGKTLRYGDHKYPADFGFTGSTGKVAVRGHMRSPPKLAKGGAVCATMPDVRAEVGKHASKSASKAHGRGRG